MIYLHVPDVNAIKMAQHFVNRLYIAQYNVNGLVTHLEDNTQLTDKTIESWRVPRHLQAGCEIFKLKLMTALYDEQQKTLTWVHRHWVMNNS